MGGKRTALQQRWIRICLGLLVLLLASHVWAAGQRKTYKIAAGDTPGAVAKKYNVTVEELFRFNNIKPNGPFRAGQVLNIPNPGEVTGSTYVVKSGDSLARIANFHGVSIRSLREANGFRGEQQPKVGTTLVIPMELRGGASRSHVVVQGDTVASIAKKYGVTPRVLMAENHLKDAAALKIGRTLVIPDAVDGTNVYKPPTAPKMVTSGVKVKGGVMHTVQPGQTLWLIARAYQTTGAAIARHNGFAADKPLSVGQKVMVPGAKSVVPVRVQGFSIQPIHFVRVWNNQSITLKLVNNNGAVNQVSRKKLSELSGPRTKQTKPVKLFHPRLILMLQRVAERWPGKTIEVISGYRPGETGSESQHTLGRAIDFRVKGIPNREVYLFCTQLPNSGCGYYPNSVFVHMDARDRSVTWTDYSAPGEAAQYKK